MINTVTVLLFDTAQWYYFVTIVSTDTVALFDEMINSGRVALYVTIVNTGTVILFI